MRTLKSLLFSILAVLLLVSGASATQVRGHLVDANGQPLNAGHLEFVLGACPTESGPATLVSGGNLTNYGPYVIKAGPGGTIIGQIIGSDQILCGGGLNTYWQVSGFNGNSTTPVWTKAAIITGGLWQADTGPYLNVTPTSLPPNPVLQNPTGDQIVTVPAGKKLQVTGTFIATLTGNATTASALATAGTACIAGKFATGVDASGNAVGCTSLPTSIVAGTGISVSGATGAVTVTNTGVTSLAGTTNQITASASTGAVTLSLPSAVTISAITLTGTPGVSATGVNSGTARASHGAFQGDWGNDLFFGHSNTAYLSTIGHDNTAGPPVICFYCYSSLTTNGWKYSGAINAPWRVRTTNGTTNGINFDQAAAGTADTDIATWTTIMGVGQTGVSVTGNISASAALIAGTSPATAGTVRLCNACNIAWENAAGTAALIGIAGTASNTLNIGYNQEINTNGGVTFSSASASRFSFMGGGTSIMSARSDGVIGFSATTTPGTNSVGISYGGAANTMSCGNGTAGDATCTFKAGTVNAGTGFQVAGAALNFSNLAGSATAVQGGTGQTAYAVGDLLVASSTTALSRLAIGGLGNCLISNGTTAAWGSCSSGVAAYTTLQNSGTAVTQRSTANFLNGLQAVDNVGSTRTDISPVYGTAANTVAQGNDSRIVNAAQVNAANGFSQTQNFNVGAASGAAVSIGNATGLAYIDASSGTSGQGGYFQGTNGADQLSGYSAWLTNNAIFNGTSWVAPRGVGVSSHGLAVSHHKNFSFNFASSPGTNGGAITWTEWANLASTGFNLETGNYLINGVQIAAANLSNGVTGSGGNIVLSNSPSITSPTIAGTISGAASGTPTVKGGTGASFDFSVNNIANTLNLLLVRESTGNLEIPNGGLLISKAGGTITLTGSTSGTTILQPSAAASGTLTLPAGTDTLMGRATTDTMTGKTFDAEGTGNSLTTVDKLWFPAAGCNNSAPTPYWDTTTTNVPSAVCVTGTNVVKGLLRYTGSTLAAQFHYKLPDDLKASTLWDVRILWLSGTASGTGTLTLDYACSGTGGTSTDDPAWTTGWVNQAVTASATTNAINSAVATGLTSTCSAGALMHFRVRRTDAAGTATNMDIYGVELTYRRTE